MINLRTTTRTFTPEEVYGMTHEELMEKLTGRQEYVDFGIVPPQPVKFLTLDGRIKTNDPTKDRNFGGPRLIIAERRLRRIVYTETGEMRAAQGNDAWIDENGHIMTHNTTLPVAIVTREVQEVQ